jgi:pimeloyl-ACP methyl ester carboxylesterase
MKAYLIGGLAADERVFRHLRFPDRYERQFLNWIDPLENESLESYAMRMAVQIDTSEKFILVGVSFGGMLATEISRLFPAEKTILIASVPHPGHLPRYFRWMQKARLPKIVPIGLIKKSVMINRLFTAETSEDKEIIREMVRAADARFIRWALTAALEWRGAGDNVDCVHIHGSKDIVFPIRFTKPSHTITKGGHLMVMDRAKDINEILSALLA